MNCRDSITMLPFKKTFIEKNRTALLCCEIIMYPISPGGNWSWRSNRAREVTTTRLRRIIYAAACMYNRILYKEFLVYV